MEGFLSAAAGWNPDLVQLAGRCGCGDSSAATCVSSGRDRGRRGARRRAGVGPNPVKADYLWLRGGRAPRFGAMLLATDELRLDKC